MTTVIVLVVVVVLLALVVAAGFVVARRRRSEQLREQFGPEYDRVLEGSQDRKDAESTLRDRRERHEQLDIRPLDDATRDRYRVEWQQTQRAFVDDPGQAVERADGLVTAIMRDRGYPVEEAFDQRAADVSVAHPGVAENYRSARRVRDAHRGGTASTEDLRAAVTSYRDLVDGLLDDGHGDDAARGTRRDGSRG